MNELSIQKIIQEHTVQKLIQERDEARTEIARLMGEIEGLGYSLARLMARDERWKQAVKEYFIRCLLNPHADTKMFVDAGFALKNGDLDALEKALKIKETI